MKNIIFAYESENPDYKGINQAVYPAEVFAGTSLWQARIADSGKNGWQKMLPEIQTKGDSSYSAA